MNKDDYEILCTMSAGRDRPPDFAVKLLEDTCERTGLDWKLRHLYLMQRGGKWAVTLSIDGFRLIGSQDPDYGGQEGPFWVNAPDAQWTDIPPDGPIYAAKVGIKHRNGTTTWGVAKYKDYKAGPMWDKFPSTMSAKCAEMLAWRKAFPGKLGGLYGLEEMAQADRTASKLVEGAPEAAPAGPSNKGSLDLFREMLKGAKNLAQVKEIGHQISTSSLSLEDKLDLHITYNEMKAKYE
jgi:hypothetical protein